MKWLIDALKGFFDTPDLENLEWELINVPEGFTNEKIEAAEAVKSQIVAILKDVKPDRVGVVKQRIKAILLLKDV